MVGERCDDLAPRIPVLGPTVDEDQRGSGACLCDVQSAAVIDLNVAVGNAWDLGHRKRVQIWAYVGVPGRVVANSRGSFLAIVRRSTSSRRTLAGAG